jgi:hypothetical protein
LKVSSLIRYVLFASLTLMGQGPLNAQSGHPLAAGDRSAGAWIGLSPSSPVGSSLGTTPDRQLLLGGLRAEWILEASGPLALAATADILPLVLVTHNPTYRDEDVLQPDGSMRRVKTETGRALVYGAGLSPLGLQVYLAQLHGARVFGGGAVGALWFTRDTPVPDLRRFNITFEYGGGVELPISATRTVLAGYKLHHFSNAYSAPRNPGVDGNVLYVGVMRRR